MTLTSTRHKQILQQSIINASTVNGDANYVERRRADTTFFACLKGLQGYLQEVALHTIRTVLSVRIDSFVSAGSLLFCTAHVNGASLDSTAVGKSHRLTSGEKFYSDAVKPR